MPTSWASVWCLLVAGCFAEERLKDPTQIRTTTFGNADRSCLVIVRRADGLGPGCSDVRRFYDLAVLRCAFTYEIPANICLEAGVMVEQECGPFQHESARVRIYCPPEYIMPDDGGRCRVPTGSRGSWWSFKCKEI